MSEPTGAQLNTSVLTPRDAKRLWREYESRTVDSGTDPNIRVGLAASFTSETLVQFAGANLVASGFDPAFSVGPYNQIFQICADPKAAFGEHCDVITLLWRLEDLMSQEIDAALLGDDLAIVRASDKIESLVRSISHLRTNFAGTIILSVPPLPMSVSTSPLSLDNPTGLGAFHRTMVMRLVDSARKIEGVRLLDLDAIQRQIGLAASYDPRQWYLYRLPFTDAFLHETGTMLSRIVTSSRRAAKKCIVLDCDNTLWGGVIGEDGIEGIEIGDDFPGSAFRDFQKLLITWRQQGVFLAVASKNNEVDVLNVFERHDAMVLRKEHLSAWQINWLPKPENISAIARSLNIGTDSLIFVDDNAMEIAYMRSAHPEVASIQLPTDPAEIVPTLQKLALFDRLDISEEDRKRADMIHAERNREALSAQVSHSDFLKDLALRFELFLAQPKDLGRITQLINKTNQFNLTTPRLSHDEVRALSESASHRVYGLRVTDKFGEYGLTGVVIAEVTPNKNAWVVHTLLLSCRIFGRGVETALISALADEARAAGAIDIIASFIETKKNMLAADFLPKHGFKRIDDKKWHLSLSDALDMPGHIKRTSAEAPVALSVA